MKDFFVAFFTNFTLMVPIASWFLCQIMKMVINAIVDGKLDVKRLFGDGGMPSGHSATVASLTVMVGWEMGIGSALFAVCAIMAIIVMHDASGVRRETGKQAVSIKQLAEIVNKAFLSKDNEIKTQNLKVLVGHTNLQVFFGALM